LTGKNELTIEKLDNALPESCRIVKKAEAYFNTLPESIPEYSHFFPANWLFQNQDILVDDDDAVEQSLSNYEKLFQKLNEFI